MATALWYFPGALGYHMLYIKSSFGSNYGTTLSGPRVVLKSKLKKQFPDAKMIHGQYGVLMHEAQMNDSRMNINTILTASVDKYMPGMKGATLANYVDFRDFVKDEAGKIIGAKLWDN